MVDIICLCNITQDLQRVNYKGYITLETSIVM